MWPFHRTPPINNHELGKQFYSKFIPLPQQVIGVGKDELLIIHANYSGPATKAKVALHLSYIDQAVDYGFNFAIDKQGRVETYGLTTNLNYDRILSQALSIPKPLLQTGY